MLEYLVYLLLIIVTMLIGKEIDEYMRHHRKNLKKPQSLTDEHETHPGMW